MCWDCERPDRPILTRIRWLEDELELAAGELALAKRTCPEVTIKSLTDHMFHILSRYNALRLEHQEFGERLKVV